MTFLPRIKRAPGGTFQVGRHEPAEATNEAAPIPSRRRKRRVRPLMVATHRWISIALGAVLLVVVLSGALLLLRPEIHKALNSELYNATPTDEPISQSQALASARTAFPDFAAADVILNRGVYEVQDVDYRQQVHVDPGTGRVLGIYRADGAEGAVFGFLENLHYCFFGCEEYPAHVAFLSAEVPFLSDPDFPLIGNEDITWGGLVLGLSALLLLTLAVTGIVLWWPGLRRIARSMRVRHRKGRYAVNYDLHKVVGMAAIPFLLMWAVTGASFEFKQVKDVWYWALPGDPPAETVFASTPEADRSVSMDQAVAIAERTLPGRGVVATSVPDMKVADSAYSIWLQDGVDPYAYGSYPGDAQVSVDRYSGKAAVTYGDPGTDPALSAVLMDEWGYPIHAGLPVNGWWRLLWLVLGLTPLLLAITGVTTWVMRRRMGRRRRRQTSPA